LAIPELRNCGQRNEWPHICDPVGPLIPEGHCYLVSGLATPIPRQGCCSRFRPGAQSQSEVSEALDEDERRREPSACQTLVTAFPNLCDASFVLPPTLPLMPPLHPIRLPPVLPGLRDVDTTLADAEGLFDEAPYEDEPACFSWKRGGRSRIFMCSYTPYWLQACRCEG